MNEAKAIEFLETAFPDITAKDERSALSRLKEAGMIDNDTITYTYSYINPCQCTDCPLTHTTNRH